MKSLKPNDVAHYIAQAPRELQDKLRQIRDAIKETAPNAVEKIS